MITTGRRLFAFMMVVVACPICVLVAVRTCKGSFNEEYETVASLELKARQLEDALSIHMFLFLGRIGNRGVHFSGLKQPGPGCLSSSPVIEAY
jgi:hypothetical protein